MGLFRALVVADLVLLVLAFFREDTGPDPLASMDEGAAVMLGLVFLALVGANLIAVLGLLMLKNWGSQLYLIVCVVGTVLTVKFFGVQETFFADTLTKASWLVTLNVLYMSQISHRKRFT